MQFSIKNNETLVFARRHLALEKLLYILIDSIENSSKYAFDKKMDITNQKIGYLDGVCVNTLSKLAPFLKENFETL